MSVIATHFFSIPIVFVKIVCEFGSIEVIWISFPNKSSSSLLVLMSEQAIKEKISDENKMSFSVFFLKIFAEGRELV